MPRSTKKPRNTPVSKQVRARVEGAGARIWRLEDFDDLPFGPVARALSRMSKVGELSRLSKGVYYHSVPTSLGNSLPNPRSLWESTAKRKHVFPSGLSAASLLGFTTQHPATGEVATSASSLPRKLVGARTVVHTRRPWAWNHLQANDAALLDVLRNRAESSELPAEATVRKTLHLLKEDDRYQRLLEVSATEPPRVRAMLGALGEELGKGQKTLSRLRDSLNPASRFDFGLFVALSHAREWQAKESR